MNVIAENGDLYLVRLSEKAGVVVDSHRHEVSRPMLVESIVRFGNWSSFTGDGALADSLLADVQAALRAGVAAIPAAG
jgi:hypothetical protein